MRKIFGRGVACVVLALAASCILPMQTAAAVAATWTQAPGSPVGTLNTDGVYCIPGSAECIAVGSVYPQYQAFVESNATGVWQTAPSGTPDSTTYTSSALDGISCTSTTFCVAVGSAVAASTGVGGPLIATFDGSSWSFQILSGSTIAHDELTSVTCVTASHCLAVGSGDLLATFDGTSWSSTVLTNPAPYSSFTLSAISCSDAADCVAVGSYTAGSTQNALAEVLSNGTWSPSAPSNVTAPDSFSGVSCMASSCVAVGYEDLSGPNNSLTLVEQYASGSWSMAAQGMSGELDSVSCPAPGVCAAVGESGPYLPLVMTSAEGTWGVQAVQSPIATNELADVSCASVSACMVAGLGVECFCIVDADYGVLLSGSILAAPDAPTGLAATLAGTDQVDLTWSAPAVDGGSPITGYDVFAGAGPGAESTAPVNASPLSGTSYTVTDPTPGTYYFTVEALNEIGASPPSNEVVAASSTTTITSSASPSVTGQGVTFTATVAAVGYGAGTPTGSVVFSVDGSAQPALSLNSGSASLTIPNPAVGTHTVSAVYSGDSVDYGSTSSVFDQTVNQANTVTTLTSSGNPSPVGQPGTITATVAPIAPGAGTPTGTVTFSVDGTAQAPVALSDASASLNLATLSAGTHQITAAYSGDGQFSADTSSPLTEDIAFSTDTLALVSTVNPSVVGQQVQVTAAVAPVAPATGTPAGTVTFTVDGTAGSPITLVSGGATLTLPALSPGSHTISATYSGNATFAPATSTTLTQTVGPADTDTALSSSANPLQSGQPGTVTATVTPIAPGSGTPTGTITFTLDGTAQPPVALANGGATLNLATLPPGTHTISAAYSGDAGFTATSSGSLTQVITQPSASVALSSSADPSVTGQPVTVTATVAPAAPATATPTGTVTFTVDGTPQTPLTLASGSASLTLATLTAGSHTITAAYSGDADYPAGTSTTLTQTVDQAATTTALASSPDPSATGQPVAFTATVIPVSPSTDTPTGTVTFTIDGTAQPPTTLTSDTATLSIPTLTSGTHTVTATYSGDADYTASTSNALTQTVQPTTAAVISLTSQTNPTVSGQSATFNVTVKPAIGTGTPTGTVTFTIDGTAQPPTTLSSGKATLRISTLTAGAHTVTASYSGDANYAAGTSSALTQTVNQAATTVTLSSSLNPSNPGQTVAFTAVVLATLPGTGTPTGTVTFTIDGIAQAPVSLGSGKSATIKTSGLSAGTHTVTAAYSGDADYTASTSTTLTQTVN